MSVYYAIILSMVVHLIIWWFSPNEPLVRQTPEETAIEVRYVEAPKPVIREVELPDHLLDPAPPPDEKAKLWSSKQVRVREEQKARNTGITQNRSPRPQQARAPQQDKGDDGAKAKIPNVLELTKKHLNERLQNLEADLPQGVSTRGESLNEDIKVGGFTALNVDPYLYYSFFTRIEELIRFRWENLIEDAIYSSVGAGYLPDQNRWITHLEIELTPEGEYVNSQVIKRSGLRGFDLAAIRAFRDSHRLPNPPKDLINEEGRVILQYAFEVQWNPKRLVRRR